MAEYHDKAASIYGPRGTRRSVSPGLADQRWRHADREAPRAFLAGRPLDSPTDELVAALARWESKAIDDSLRRLINDDEDEL
jgi:hypothetical protein